MLCWFLNVEIPSKVEDRLSIGYLQWPKISPVDVAVVQSLSRVQLFVTPWRAACQASLSFIVSRSSHIHCSVTLSNHLILCHPLLFLPSILPSLGGFHSESALGIRWPNCWSFSLSISPSNEYSGLIPLEWTGWISLQSKGLSRVFSNTTVQKHQFFSAQPSLQCNPHNHTWLLEKL